MTTLEAVRAGLAVYGVPLADRDVWGATAPSAPLTPLPERLGLFVTHHDTGGRPANLAAERAQVKADQRYHMTSPDRLYRDIAYNFLIGPSGTVYVGRGLFVGGGDGMPDDANEWSVCALGNYDRGLPPTELMQRAYRALWTVFLDLAAGPGARNIGDRDRGPSTACPGRLLYARLPWQPLDPPTPNPGDDMDERALLALERIAEAAEETAKNTGLILDHLDGIAHTVNGKQTPPVRTILGQIRDNTKELTR